MLNPGHFLQSFRSVPTPTETIFQTFEWYVDADGKHYQRIARDIPSLETLGVTKLWIPPACKGRSVNDNGYGIYDLWDLGEFEQKGTRRTKWGTYEDLKMLQKVAKQHKLG